MDRIRLGVIGCGSMCRHHLNSVGGRSASILQDEVPPATAVDGARTTRFIRKCFESARTGRVIRWG
jgi:hypothetical protein